MINMHPLIENARAHAIESHDRCQHKRSNGEPYWRHPERVVATLAAHSVSPEIQAAGWLHDVAEDCAATQSECEQQIADIERRFGAPVAKLVREVTNFFTHEATMEQKQQRLIEHAPHLCEGAKWIKLADRRDNIADMSGWAAEKKQRYARATLKLIEALKPYPADAAGISAEISQRAQRVLDDLAL